LNSKKVYSVDFIVGMPRSGTTLLLSMLNSVEQNMCIPEIPIALYLYNSHRNRTSFEKEDATDILSLKSKLNYIRHVTIDEKFFFDNTSNCNSYSDFIESAYLTTLESSKKVEKIQNIIDKNPIYTFYPEILLSVFPKAKFVLMARNPHGYVNSCIESVDAGKKVRSAEFYSLAYNKYAHEITRIQRKYPNQSLIINYEELVVEPELTLQKICNFLSIDFDSEMLEFYNKSFNLKINKDDVNDSNKERVKHKYESLSKPVNTSRIESWKSKLSLITIKTISSITFKESQKLGYNLSKEKIIYSFNYLKSFCFIELYFLIAKNFYFLPIKLREIYRIKI
jgi:hypothetical protein